MRLSQSALFQLCCASFLAGLLLSFFCDILYMIQLFLTPSQIRYTVSKIQRMRASHTAKKNIKKKKGLRRVTVLLSDILFCLVAAIALILLLYWFNNGAFRVAAPLGMALGFYLCHISISKGIRTVLQWVTFFVEKIFYTLCFPIKYLLAFFFKKCKKSVEVWRLSRLARQRQTYTKQALQNVGLAAEKLLPKNAENRMSKGDNYARKSKKAV